MTQEHPSPPSDSQGTSRREFLRWTGAAAAGSALLGVGFVLPLVVYLAMRHESEYVAANAREALNFHISVLIYSLCCIPLVFILIGIPLLIVLGLGSLVLAIIATIKASNGQCYRYPLTLRLVS